MVFKEVVNRLKDVQVLRGRLQKNISEVEQVDNDA